MGDIKKIKTTLHSQSSLFYVMQISFLSYDWSLFGYLSSAKHFLLCRTFVRRRQHVRPRRNCWELSTISTRTLNPKKELFSFNFPLPHIILVFTSYGSVRKITIRIYNMFDKVIVIYKIKKPDFSTKYPKNPRIIACYTKFKYWNINFENIFQFLTKIKIEYL